MITTFRRTTNEDTTDASYAVVINARHRTARTTSARCQELMRVARLTTKYYETEQAAPLASEKNVLLIYFLFFDIVLGGHLEAELGCKAY